MIDFKITNKGDLILKEQTTLPGFKINFKISRFPGFIVKFFQAPMGNISINNGLRINFHTKDVRQTIKHKVEIVEEMEERIQQIIIRLRTELTELPKRQTVGSKLRLIKHEHLNSKINLARIETITADAIKNIVPNLEVVAKAELGVGNFYCQNVNIYIYSNGFLFYKFNI